MTKWQPVKIMFDLDDPFHTKLYEHLKKQTNGSSFIRTLLHHDLNSYEIVKEQKDIEVEDKNVVVSDIYKSASVSYTQPDKVKINLNNIPVNYEDDLFIDDLI